MSSPNLDLTGNVTLTWVYDVGTVTAVRGADRRTETKKLMNAFSNIAERWDLSTDEQLALLGHPSRSTYFKWKKEGGILPYDTKDRISHLLKIYEALRILFLDDDAADRWVQKNNEGPMFGGQSALNLMIEGGLVGLYKVQAYLDAQRGGWS